MDLLTHLKNEIKIREDIRQGDATWDDVINLRTTSGLTRLTKDSVQRSYAIYDDLLEVGYSIIPPNISDTGDTNYRATTELRSNGEIVQDRLLKISSEDVNNPETLLRAHGYDPECFELLSSRSSMWQSGENGLIASRVVVKNKTEQGLKLQDIEDYFNTKVLKNFIKLDEPKLYSPEGEILEINLPDLHLGLYGSMAETGEEYNIKIAKARLIECIEDIIDRCGQRKLKKIYFVTLGDLLHVDNAQGMTTKGTPQHMDTRPTNIIIETIDLLIKVISMLGQLAPVEVIYLPGNHDNLLGFTVAQAVKFAFNKEDSVTFDVGPRSRKFRHLGKVLIGWNHGNMQKSLVGDWLQTEARAEFGTSRFVEVHCGHYHSQETKEKSGTIIRYLPTICGASSWEYDEGYVGATKTLTSFIWNENKGLREIWFSNV